MNYLLLLSIVVLSSCTNIDDELNKAIAFGEIVDLNEYSDNVEKNLFVRLYRSPIHQENCFKETQGVCKYQYYLSVSTFDEYPKVAIYKLAEQGQIKDINWSTANQIDTAKIEFTINSYTDMAVANNPLLMAEIKKLLVVVSPDSIAQKQVDD